MSALGRKPSLVAVGSPCPTSCTLAYVEEEPRMGTPEGGHVRPDRSRGGRECQQHESLYREPIRSLPEFGAEVVEAVLMTIRDRLKFLWDPYRRAAVAKVISYRV